MTFALFCGPFASDFRWIIPVSLIIHHFFEPWSLWNP